MSDIKFDDGYNKKKYSWRVWPLVVVSMLAFMLALGLYYELPALLLAALPDDAAHFGGKPVRTIAEAGEEDNGEDNNEDNSEDEGAQVGLVRPDLVIPALTAEELALLQQEAARDYMQGAAAQEYTLPSISRGSVFSNRNAGKMVALTFDDGPFTGKTPQILATLAEYDARATFFVLGRYVQNHPELAQQILAAGCELGSHSWFHSRQTALSAAERAADFARVDAAFEEAVGFAPYLFRAPYGAVDETVHEDIAGQNMISVLWSIDTEDWRATSGKQIYDSVMGSVKDGDVILMHENADYTLEVLPDILAALQAEGYQIVTVSELVYAGTDAKAAADAELAEIYGLAEGELEAMSQASSAPEATAQTEIDGQTDASTGE